MKLLHYGYCELQIQKKYAEYILVYIKVKTVEISKYDMSCVRYCIIIAMCRPKLLNDPVILNGLK
jgi:hypothetical protein